MSAPPNGSPHWLSTAPGNITILRAFSVVYVFRFLNSCLNSMILKSFTYDWNIIKSTLKYETSSITVFPSLFCPKTCALVFCPNVLSRKKLQFILLSMRHVLQ